MRLPKSMRKNTRKSIPRIIIQPPFTRTSVRMMTSPESKPHVNLASRPHVNRGSKPHVNRVKAAAHRMSAPNAQSVQNVMAAVARRVAVSAMARGRRVVPVRTSPSVKITLR